MAAKFVSAAEMELACSVCFQFFVKPHEPKNLPECSHIMCQICLKKMVEGGRKTIKCPQCNKISPLTKGIDGLTTTLALRNLAERHPEGIKQYKEYLQNQLKSGQEKTAKQVTKLKELIKQTQQAIQLEEQKIEKSVAAVMEKAQELINQLRNTSGLDQLQEQLAKLETEMKFTDTSESKLDEMTDEEFHTQTDAITNQIEKLKIDEVEKITTAPCVGKFIANIRLGAIMKPRQLELVQTVGRFRGASDIASISNGVLAVIDSNSTPPQASVFQKDQTGYKQQSKFPVQQMIKYAPLGIALSEEGKCFITKCAAGFDIYSADGKFEKTETVIDQQSGQGEMDGISSSICCTKDGRILVGSFIKAEGEESKKYVVTVHDTRGSLMKTIPIGIGPGSITDMNGTHVAALHPKANKVCVYDMQTGPETLSIDFQMPYGICYDEQFDCLLIGRLTEVDGNGNRALGSGVIEQYCRISGKLVACLAHGLYKPWGLTITDDNMLAVADHETVKIYKMD